MARHLFILLKFLLLCFLIYGKVRSDEWEEQLNLWGRTIFSLARPERVRFLGFTEAMLNFFIFALAINLLVIFLSSVYRRRKKLPRGKKDNVLLGLENIYLLLMTAAVLLTGLGFFGVETRSLFTGMSIVAAALAIILRDYIVDVISGIAISFSSEISIDDYVKIGDFKGKVVDLGIVKISLLNDDDDLVFIPNNTVYASNVINYTKSGIRRVTIEFEVGLPFPDSIESLEKDFTEALLPYESHIEEGSYRLRTEDIRHDYLLLKFQFTLKQVNRELEREIRKKAFRRVANHVRQG